MKTNYFFLIAALFISSTVLGQMTITYEGNCPQVGDHFNEAIFNEGVDPGPGGANQTWDFSGVTSSDSYNTVFVDPASTPYGEFFSESNIAVQYSEEGFYNYGKTSSSDFLNIGVAGQQEGFEIIINYSDPHTLMVFPFSFEDTYEDDFYGEFAASPLEIHQTGSSTSVADAWGSITTPHASYADVLRVRTETTQTDSAWMNGMFVYSSTSHEINYTWYAPGQKMPVFYVTIYESDGVTDTTGGYLTDAQGLFETGTASAQISVYPNPATQLATVEFSVEKQGDITITVTDISGKEIQRWNKATVQGQKQRFSIPLDELQTGIYFVNVSDGTTVKSQKLIVRK